MLTRTQISKRLGVSMATVTEWIDSAQLKAINVSPSPIRAPLWRVSEINLAEFLDARSNTQMSERRRRQATERTRKIL